MTIKNYLYTKNVYKYTHIRVNIRVNIHVIRVFWSPGHVRTCPGSTWKCGKCSKMHRGILNWLFSIKYQLQCTVYAVYKMIASRISDFYVSTVTENLDMIRRWKFQELRNRSPHGCQCTRTRCSQKIGDTVPVFMRQKSVLGSWLSCIFFKFSFFSCPRTLQYSPWPVDSKNARVSMLTLVKFS